MQDGYVIKEFIHIETSIEPDDKSRTPRKFRTFRIVDALFPDKLMALSVVISRRVAGSGTIANIDTTIQKGILECMRDLMDEVPKDERYMLVVDLTPFPDISVMIDRVGPRPTDEEQFSEGAHLLWSTYDMKKEIPVIIVNVEVPMTMIRLVPLPWVE